LQQQQQQQQQQLQMQMQQSYLSSPHAASSYTSSGVFSGLPDGSVSAKHESPHLQGRSFSLSLPPALGMLPEDSVGEFGNATDLGGELPASSSVTRPVQSAPPASSVRIVSGATGQANARAHAIGSGVKPEHGDRYIEHGLNGSVYINVPLTEADFGSSLTSQTASQMMDETAQGSIHLGVDSMRSSLVHAQHQTSQWGNLSQAFNTVGLHDPRSPSRSALSSSKPRRGRQQESSVLQQDSIMSSSFLESARQVASAQGIVYPAVGGSANNNRTMAPTPGPAEMFPFQGVSRQEGRSVRSSRSQRAEGGAPSATWPRLGSPGFGAPSPAGSLFAGSLQSTSAAATLAAFERGARAATGTLSASGAMSLNAGFSPLVRPRNPQSSGLQFSDESVEIPSSPSFLPLSPGASLSSFAFDSLHLSSHSRPTSPVSLSQSSQHLRPSISTASASRGSPSPDADGMLQRKNSVAFSIQRPRSQARSRSGSSSPMASPPSPSGFVTKTDRSSVSPSRRPVTIREILLTSSAFAPPTLSDSGVVVPQPVYEQMTEAQRMKPLHAAYLLETRPSHPAPWKKTDRSPTTKNIRGTFSEPAPMQPRSHQERMLEKVLLVPDRTFYDPRLEGKTQWTDTVGKSMRLHYFSRFPSDEQLNHQKDLERAAAMEQRFWDGRYMQSGVSSLRERESIYSGMGASNDGRRPSSRPTTIGSRPMSRMTSAAASPMALSSSASATSRSGFS
jgi:hypothetical protein